MTALQHPPHFTQTRPGFVVAWSDCVILFRDRNRVTFAVGDAFMTPIKLDAKQLLGFDHATVGAKIGKAGAKIGISKKPDAKIGLIKKRQSAKIGVSKVRAK